MAAAKSFAMSATRADRVAVATGEGEHRLIGEDVGEVVVLIVVEQVTVAGEHLVNGQDV